MRVPSGMFTPRHAPLKEGRSFPGLPYAGPPRRNLRSRHGALILLVLICIPLIYFLTSSGAASSTIQTSLPSDRSREFVTDPEVVLRPNPNESPGRQQFPPNQAGADPPAPESPDAAPVKDSVQKAEPPLQNPKAPVADLEDEEPATSRGNDRSTTAPKSSPKGPGSGVSSQDSISFNERPKFERALARVISLLPGEMEGRDLLRQVEGTGKEKLREMGLRVREYKKFFEAWEDLHLTFDEEGGSYIRDDVIQYLRHHVHKSSSVDLDKTGLAQTIHSYEAYRYFLVKFGQLLFPWTAPYFPDHMTLHSHFKKGGRGIVLTAGDDQAPFLLTTIPTFRKLGCTLPIEVMYLGDSDLSEDYRADLEAIDGVITRDIAQMVNDEGWKLAGWAAKPFAILHSSFREVLFIDADSLFFKNPEILFDDPAYQKTGALFFRDRLIMPESKKRWLQQILPKPISRQVKQSRFWTGDSGHMQESGVIVVDKWRHFIALLLVTRMNGPDRDGNRDEGRVGIYDMVYGDKETFWIGWELVGDLDYAFHQGDAGTMGTVQEDKNREEGRKEGNPNRRKKQKKIILDDNGEIIENPEGEEGWEEVEAEEEDPGNTGPSSYTICSPQLLHLDLEGKPLWFNGWLLDNKFADRKQKKFGKFETYLIEPRDIREPGAWQLEESNMCCLTTDPPLKRDFTPEEREILDMMIQQAREVGIAG
ncbi:uncharacterized protein Z518_05279 [Rhinocladiella mackenziei CBS 650.93]|uniref:Alpha-1,3-mannosyltransferase n=1 Tax=Rhinocladiella mackenziei CBS 650.93 TaxID=1442369 RepID=A0A0D2IMN4_9EURO|nr:uncharacterized protein Z518_05279 [Rhinocladiella mackenziei CBS 650.93]KIX04411.1 hypothetical protein Z518_05279 [Rhinocladiella mackenziei CBS 650.93]